MMDCRALTHAWMTVDYHFIWFITLMKPEKLASQRFVKSSLVWIAGEDGVKQHV